MPSLKNYDSFLVKKIFLKMPTKGKMPRSSLVHDLTENTKKWTDDLPVCGLTGVGLSVNQIYRRDGLRNQAHECEDTSFHFKLEDKEIYFYGIFDGHDGPNASNFAVQWMPAEVLLDQLKGKQTDEEIREVLYNAFDSVERNFFKSIDDLLAEKEFLQLQLLGLNEYAAVEKHPDIILKLQNVAADISGGTTAVVALIYCKKLYVANVGDCRAILCKRSDNGEIEVQQLSVDHDIKNEDELLRLSQLGLDIEKIRNVRRLGTQRTTRCLGNYHVKGGYKDFDILSAAIREPVIADPFIRGGIPIDDSWLFLILMSSGLYKTLEEATHTEQVNRDVVNLVLEQFETQTTLMGVAQGVVDRVVRLHHDTYMNDSKEIQNRDDITLLVRNFNQPLGPQPPTLNHGSSTFGSSSMDGPRLFTSRRTSLVLDEEGRLEPYVDFSQYFLLVEEAKQQGLLPHGIDF